MAKSNVFLEPYGWNVRIQRDCRKLCISRRCACPSDPEYLLQCWAGFPASSHIDCTTGFLPDDWIWKSFVAKILSMSLVRSRTQGISSLAGMSMRMRLSGVGAVTAPYEGPPRA